MKYLLIVHYSFFILVFFLNCDFSSSKNSEKASSILEEEETLINIDTTTHNIYPWLENYDYTTSLVNQILPPKDYKRIKLVKNSFADWLRHLPLKPKGTKVNTFDGNLKFLQTVHARVIDIDTGKRDLQQCADAIMRLKAEYHFSQKNWEAIHFNYTSGDSISFEDWRRGKQPIVKGNKVRFTSPSGKTNNSYNNFKRYLQNIFSYAGTASLSKELQTVPMDKMQIGDVFIQGGFPGHAVIVVDMAENSAGKKLFLLAQSYMPAQDMHILKNWKEERQSPWYDVDFGAILHTPEWQFKKGDLKKFKD